MQQVFSQNQNRIESIDLLRGLVMIIMALDHTRDYFHADSFSFDPTDLTKTNIILFFTRWITHFCAPVFMFLSGTSAFLVGRRKGKKELSRFLVTRGLWLLVLELSIVNFAWFFDIHFTGIYLVVIWALGFSMIILSALIHLPLRLILLAGILAVAGHNLLDPIHVDGNNLKAFLWAELHVQQRFRIDGHIVGTGYPLLPWIGIMALGYCFGSLYKKGFPSLERKKILLAIGGLAVALFVLLRAINMYGDPHPWSQQPSFIYSILSFLNVTKYPPSLLYALVTLGPAILFLAVAEEMNRKFLNPLIRVGRVPMFFYLLHIYLIHLTAMLAAQLSGYQWSDMVLNDWPWLQPQLKGYGFSLGFTYLVWICIVIVLYPLCRSYDSYKTRHKEKWWLSYL